MTLVPTVDVLMWDRQALGGAVAQLWTPATGMFTAVPNVTTDIFCASHSALADGRIFVAGGDNASAGLRDANIFDPSTGRWALAASMAFDRYYPTATTLGDGRVLAIAGSCSGCPVRIPEIYDPTLNTWVGLPNASMVIPQYPFMFVLPDGRVLLAGSWQGNIATQALDVRTSTWAMIDPVAVDGGTAVMYTPGKVLKSGT